MSLASRPLHLCRSCVVRSACRLHRPDVQRLTTHPLKQHQTDCLQQHRAQRSLTTTTFLRKKGGKGAKSTSADGEASATSDPFDFSELESGIKAAQTKLKEDLSKLRAGGRFNPEVVENLRVQLQKESKHTERLSDLAQVVPRGRVLQLLIGDKEYIKPITSAIQSSNLNLTPQPDPQNPLQLNINLPPPTTESRKAAVQAAVKAGDTANTAVRTARGAQQKVMRAIELDKSARPDDLRKARDRMEKVVEAGSAEVKKILDSAKKVLES